MCYYLIYFSITFSCSTMCGTLTAEINSKFNLNQSNGVAKLCNDAAGVSSCVAASVRKINKTANFIALNVYAQIACRFVAVSSVVLSNFSGD